MYIRMFKTELAVPMQFALWLPLVAILATFTEGSAAMPPADEPTGNAEKAEGVTTGAEKVSPVEESDASSAWRTEVLPILEAHCLECHGSDTKSAQLDLRDPAQLLRGGKSGPAMVPASPAESRILEVVQPEADPHMPPGGEQLSDEEIASIERWIARLSPEEWPTQAAQDGDAPTRQETWLPPGAEPTTVIDLGVQLGWQQRGVQPSGRCDDRTFARRAYLDLIGRIPSRDELHAFLDQHSSDKRARLVDQLLESPEYAKHMAGMFDTMLMGRGNRGDRRRREQHQWMAYLERAFHSNQPWNEVVQDVLLARPASEEDEGSQWYLYERDEDPQQMAEAASAGLFGVQIDCAQCHDHPLAAEIEQRHYWGLVAFFRRSQNVDTDAGPRVAESAVGGFEQYSDLSGKSHSPELTFVGAPVVAEEQPEDSEGLDEEDEEKDSDDNYRPGVNGGPRIPKFSRREQLVEQVVKDHPRIAKAMVNRMWGLLLGRGLVHPVDKIDSSHPASHPKLLEWLAEDFEENAYDVKRLVRSIVLSQPYQLETTPADGDAHDDAFAYAIEKPLTAEMMLRSLAVTLGADPSSGEFAGGLRDDLIEAFPDVLPEERLTNLQQSLLLSNHQELNKLIDELAGSHEELVSGSESQRLERAFESAFGRLPSDEESAMAAEFLQTRPPEEGASQLMWALVTSAEFRFNH